MVDPTTPNLVMAQPIRGSDVGTWDTPVNGNTGILDNAFGGVTSVALTSASIVLTSSQAQASIIRVTGTLTASPSLVLSGINKFWIIDNKTVANPASFSVVLTNGSTGRFISAPPGQSTLVYCDGFNFEYASLPAIGSYMDYASASTPAWVFNCTIPPYLSCNGTAFSSATYPILASQLGTTTLPDSRGRFRANINSGTGRLNAAVGGLDGNTLLIGGGAEARGISLGNLPNLVLPVTISDPGHSHPMVAPTGNTTTGGGGFACGGPVAATATAASGTGITATTALAGSAVPLPIVAPAYVGGITLIRAG